MIKTLIVSFTSFLSLVVFGQTCNEVQTLSNNQKTSVNILIAQLDDALVKEAWSSVDSLSLLLQSAFGQEGGKPDSKETYYTLTTTKQWLNLDEALVLSRKLIDKDSSIYRNLWQVAQGISPIYQKPHSIFLRSAAEIAGGLYQLASVETDANRKNNYISWANRALDTLATKQLPSGAYPFPDLRSTNDPTFTPIINHFLATVGKDSLQVLQNGWIIDDKNLGEFKFDAGVIANAYYIAYKSTGLTRYKENVLRIANYCYPLAMNSNYNYNTFASLALTHGYALTQNKEFLDRAESTLRYAVVPGQLVNGRWVDGHNANSRYHNILIYNSTPTLLQLAKNSTSYDTLLSMVRKAVLNQLNYTASCGSATGFRWLVSAFNLDSTIFSPTEYLALKNLLGNYVQQSKINGKYLDIPSMGAYIELLNESKTAAISTHSPSEKIAVFPNPTQNIVTIRTPFPITQLTKFTITDIYGKSIELHPHITNNEFGNTIEINTEFISTGTYLISIEHATDIYIHQLHVLK